MEERVIFCFIVLGISILFFSNVLAEEDLMQEAYSCLEDSVSVMDNLNSSGFNFQRVNDTYVQAESMFYAQEALKKSGRVYNFSIVLDYCSEIKNIEVLAYRAEDELTGLMRFYNDSLTEEMNTSSVDLVLDEILDEINSERYERVEPLIEKGYTEIINTQSQYSALNVVYSATTKTLKNFVMNNWIYISVTSIFGVIIILIFKNTISQWLIRRKISSLEHRKDTIRDLIRQTQRGYFEDGGISEVTYIIRIKKFGELIRDIDRQIPLLQEQLLKFLKKKDRVAHLGGRK